MARSLESARLRSEVKSRRFVDAAISVMSDSEGMSFTVKQVVERSGLSLRSFYLYFAGKDELLLAVFEEFVLAGAEAGAEWMSSYEDPLQRLRAFVVGLLSESVGDPIVTHASVLAREHLRLAEARPVELRTALEPLMSVLTTEITRGVGAGVIRRVDPRHSAAIVLHLVLAHLHASLLGYLAEDAASVEELWEFCRRALAADPVR